MFEKPPAESATVAPPVSAFRALGLQGCVDTNHSFYLKGKEREFIMELHISEHWFLPPNIMFQHSSSSFMKFL